MAADTAGRMTNSARVLRGLLAAAVCLAVLIGAGYIGAAVLHPGPGPLSAAGGRPMPPAAGGGPGPGGGTGAPRPGRDPAALHAPTDPGCRPPLAEQKITP